MDTRDLTAIVKGFAPVIKDEIEKAIAPLVARILELENSGLKYLGVFQTSMAYRKGNVVTFDGAAWCATRDVSVEKPGSTDGWQLMIKSGRDASAATATPRVNGHYSRARSP
jgi:hypothetical protein